MIQVARKIVGEHFGKPNDVVGQHLQLSLVIVNTILIEYILYSKTI